MRDVQFPFGADILPSPVTKTWAAVVSDPPGSTDGGNIINAVSTALSIAGGDPSGGVSASVGTKSRGLLIMAMHRATPVATPTLVGSGDSMEDTSKSQLIVSSRPVSDKEYRRRASGPIGVEDELWLRI
jgi:hypothetical protein